MRANQRPLRRCSTRAVLVHVLPKHDCRFLDVRHTGTPRSTLGPLQRRYGLQSVQAAVLTDSNLAAAAVVNEDAVLCRCGCGSMGSSGSGTAGQAGALPGGSWRCKAGLARSALAGHALGAHPLTSRPSLVTPLSLQRPANCRAGKKKACACSCTLTQPLAWAACWQAMLVGRAASRCTLAGPVGSEPAIARPGIAGEAERHQQRRRRICHRSRCSTTICLEVSLDRSGRCHGIDCSIG